MNICTTTLMHLVAIVMLVFAGCSYPAQTVPNKPDTGSLPAGFQSIQNRNPLLVREIGKLPELLDGVTDSERQAIARISDLYAEAPDSFDAAFEKMYHVGLPEVRRYCTPLQALFWIARDQPETDLDRYITPYSLKQVLKDAWFELNKFSKENGWDDFNTVMDRLNAPQLIDYYQRQVISYRYRRGHGDSLAEAKNVFADKSGHCAQITAFTIYALKRSGYAAEMLTIDAPRLSSPKGKKHRVTLFEVNGKKYIMDNGRRFTIFGIVREQDYSPIFCPYNRKYATVWDELLTGIPVGFRPPPVQPCPGR